MPPSSESITVTVLPDVLALVHIPRRRLKTFSHHVVKQILAPSPSFLNITCNRIELSLFAHQSVLAEFEPLARKDRNRLRRSTSLKQASPHSSALPREPIEVSYDTWNVLQIDSHDDRLDNAGARVREISAPLAEAGISILYQSSYMSDFIFVKTTRLSQVLSRLALAGFVEYSFDLSLHILPSPGQDDDEQLFALDSKSEFHGSDSTPLMRRRSADVGSTSLVLQRDEIPVPKCDKSTSEGASDTHTPTPPASAFNRRSSLSPCAGDVQILDPALACVGLSDACAETWASKIIKLVAYPELIESFPPFSSISSPACVCDPYESLRMNPFDESEDHAFSKRISHPVPPAPFPPDAWSSSASISDSASSSIETSPASSDEDGYFSSASIYSTSPSTPSLLSSCSYPELSDSSSALSARVHYRSRPRLSRLRTQTAPVGTPSAAEDLHEKAVPFFSFTRTAEGSSLTTSLPLIAALFPPNERHMVICGDELRTADEQSREHWRQLQSGAPSPVNSTMKCLQIDLQRFGLDKHGLISRFSKVLDSNGINHRYYSTYKTANLLVDKADAVRAQMLLRSC